MNSITAQMGLLCRLGWIVLILLWAARSMAAAGDEFKTMADLRQSVVTLLETGDVSRFADEVTIDTNRLSGMTNTLGKPAAAAISYLVGGRRDLTNSAAYLLVQTERMGLRLGEFKFVSQPLPEPGTNIGTIEFKHGVEELPFFRQVEVPISVSNRTLGTNSPLAGNGEVVLRDVVRTPEGWFVRGGIQWGRLSEGVGDPLSLNEIALLKKVARRESLSPQDDPSLGDLAKLMERFLKSGDIAPLIGTAIDSPEQIWSSFLKANPTTPVSEKPKILAERKRYADEIAASVESLLAQIRRLKIDMQSDTFRVSKVEAKGPWQNRFDGSISELWAAEIRVTLSLSASSGETNSAAGVDVFALAAGPVSRVSGQWRLMGAARWDQFPARFMDEETKAAMKLENYLAIVRAFPPEHAVPDIDFQLINGGAKKRLSDYRGKVLVLDWWATWCGPCQEPMAEFQRVAAAHPEWKDKVVMLTLSIDDSPETAAKHLTRRGWTNAVNAWAGEGEFRSESAKIFRLRGVPTSYVIGTNGRVIANGGSGQLDRNLEGVISFGLGEKQPAIR